MRRAKICAIVPDSGTQADVYSFDVEGEETEPLPYAVKNAYTIVDLCRSYVYDIIIPPKIDRQQNEFENYSRHSPVCAYLNSVTPVIKVLTNVLRPMALSCALSTTVYIIRLMGEGAKLLTIDNGH